MSNTPNRASITFLSQHATLQEEQVQHVLEEHVYPDKKSWQKFLSIALLVLGLGFVVSGIVFFFAFNWDKLTKFEKLGLIGGLFTASVLVSLMLKGKEIVRQIVLTFSALLVGVLFSVFGQIYQTGANAYDFFLAWTIFAAMWVWAGNFPPLTSIWLILAHVTYFLYAEQFGAQWGIVIVSLVVFVADFLLWIVLKLLSQHKLFKAPSWMLTLLAAYGIYQNTIGMCVMIYDKPQLSSLIIISATLIIYSIAAWYAFTKKKLSLIAFLGASVVTIIGALILQIDRHSENGFIFLVMTLYVSGSISLLVYQIIQLQKKWAHE